MMHNDHGLSRERDLRFLTLGERDIPERRKAEAGTGSSGRWAMPGLMLAAWIAVVTQLVNADEPTLRILSGSRTPEGFFQLQIAASKKLTYLVQASTNLMDWIPLNTNVATGPLAEFVDTAASSYPRRFYRLADRPGGLLLSMSSAKPGETLVIAGGPFNPDAPVSVQFLDVSGMEVRVRSFNVTTGTVTVAVPFMVNADLPRLRGGLTTVSVRQENAGVTHVYSSAQPLRIDDLPTTGLGAGAVTLEYLNQVSNLLARPCSKSLSEERLFAIWVRCLGLMTPQNAV